jgi:hemoglobin/transferrin/lactoferrin receptor protein
MGKNDRARCGRGAKAVAVLMATAAVVATGIVPAMAQAQTRAPSFEIPAQSLADALVAFGMQSGYQVVVDGAAIRGVQSPGANGRMTAAQALGRLLADTGFTYRISGNAVTIERLPDVADGAILLGTLRVEGASSGGGIAGSNSGATGSHFGDGSDTGDLAFRSAQSASYISRDEVERNRGFQPSDMFRGTPGVLSGDTRNSGALDINIRGMQGMGRVPVVIDGSQQSTTVYRGYSGVASRSYIDPDMIGGVEVLKGPSSGVEGVGSIGGVISMRTIDAQDILLPGRSFGVRIRGGFNTNTREAPETYTPGGLRESMLGRYKVGCNYACGALDTLPSYQSVNQLGNPRGLDRPSWIKPGGGNGSIAVAKSWDFVDLVGAVTYRKTGNYFAGANGTAPHLTYTDTVTKLSAGREIYYTTIGYGEGLNRFRAGEEVLNTSSENLSYLAKATIRPADDHALELAYMKFKSWFGEAMPSSIIRGDGALQAPMSRIDLDTYTARYKWKPDSDLIDMRINASRTELDNQIRTAYDFSSISPELKYIDPYDQRTHRTGFDISNRAMAKGWWGDLTVNVGGSFSYETMTKIPGAKFEGARDGWRREWSGFGDVEWLPIEFLKFNGALRYSTFKSYDRKLSRRYYPLEKRWSDYYNLHQNEGGWAPIAAITMMPRTWLQVYARYAEAIRLPSLFEVTTGFSANPIDAMKPEHARNWEFGVNVSKDGLLWRGDALRLKLAYFNNKAKNYITRGVGSTFADPDEAIRNIDLARFKGYEASFEYRAGPVKTTLFGTHYTEALFCDWVLKGTSTRPLPAQYECNGGFRGSYGRNHVPPEWAGGGSVELDLMRDRLNLFARVTHTGRRPSESVAVPGAIEVIEWNPYTLVDASARFKINDHVRVELTADNLLDRYYMDALTLGLMASPGRTIRFGTTLNF